jgi:hypothetical protein
MAVLPGRTIGWRVTVKHQGNQYPDQSFSQADRTGANVPRVSEVIQAAKQAAAKTYPATSQNDWAIEGKALAIEAVN